MVCTDMRECPCVVVASYHQLVDVMNFPDVLVTLVVYPLCLTVLDTAGLIEFKCSIQTELKLVELSFAKI